MCWGRGWGWRVIFFFGGGVPNKWLAFWEVQNKQQDFFLAGGVRLWNKNRAFRLHMKTWSSVSKFWNFKSFCSLHLLQASMFSSFSVCWQLVQTDFVLIGQVTLPLVTRVQVHRLQVIVKIWVSLELLEILKPWYQFSLLRCISGFYEDPSVSKSNRECLFWPL